MILMDCCCAGAAEVKCYRTRQRGLKSILVACPADKQIWGHNLSRGVAKVLHGAAKTGKGITINRLEKRVLGLKFMRKQESPASLVDLCGSHVRKIKLVPQSAPETE